MYGELLSFVVVNLLFLFQILENDQSAVQYFMSEIDKIRLKQLQTVAQLILTNIATPQIGASFPFFSSWR